MKDAYKIVEYYNSKIDKNLFPVSEFTIKEFSTIQNTYDKKNQELIELVKKKRYSSKYIQIIISDLQNVCDQLYSETLDYHIPIIEQTPLTRFKIKYDDTPLKITYSAITIVNYITKLIHSLKCNFPNDLKINNNIKSIKHAFPYLNLQGYYRHIFYKLISPNFLIDDCDNNKDDQVEKINEFLEIFINRPLSFPINYNNKIIEKDNYCDIEGINPLIIDIKYSDAVFSQAFYLFPDKEDIENNINNLEEKIILKSNSQLEFI